MSALPKPALPDHIREEIARLKGVGFSLLPLGGGPDGKRPAVKAWTGAALPLAQVFAPMYRIGSRAYGVRLDGLAVVDADTADPGLIEKLEARFGASPVHVRTPRGLHLYYRATHPVPSLRREGLPVDIKTGPSAYVVGPWSERRDGGLYTPVRGLLGVEALTALGGAQMLKSQTQMVPVGERHSAMIKEAMGMVEYVDDPDELAANLIALRDDQFFDPESMPDNELHGIARWAWKCRLEGRIFRGRNSDVRVSRLALDVLRVHPNASDAQALLMTLIDKHGHLPGKRFCLSHKGMQSAGLTDLSRRKFLAARRLLEDTGLIRLVDKHRAGLRGQQFILTRMRPEGLDADRIIDLIGRGAPEANS